MSRHVRIPSDRHRHAGAVRVDGPGTVLHCLVLARGPEEWVAVDVATGALVRTHPADLPALVGLAGSGASEPADGAITDVPRGANGLGGGANGFQRSARELELVEIELAADLEPADPGRPEAIALARAPERLGTPRRRAVRRLLRGLLPVDPKRPLLGSLGPSIAYEDLDGTRPSVAVVTTDRLPMFATDSRGSWCQFTLGGRKHRLTVVDERVIAATSGRRGELLGSDSVTAAIGGTPKYLVIGLGTPYQGQAPKLVLSALPRV